MRTGNVNQLFIDVVPHFDLCPEEILDNYTMTKSKEEDI